MQPSEGVPPIPELLPVASGYLRIVARMLGLQERQLPQLLAGTGLPVSILMPGDESFLSGIQLLRILENGHRLMGGPGFGLALGRQLGPDSHGPIGYLSLASPDLLSSLRALAEYLPARLPLITLNVELDDEWLECSYEVLLTPPDYILQSMCETFALAVQSQVEAILRRKATEAVIEFSHSSPSYLDMYADYIHGQYSFASKRVVYRLPANLAHTPNTSGDSEAYSIIRDRCASLLESQPAVTSSVADRVRRLLLSQPQESVNEEQVARALFVSKRTLARRLGQEATTYRAIRDQVLSELACQALQESSQSVESIAASLGYHDSAAFRKAFRRWTGQSPRQFRAR